jgi:hypothetical protein
MSYQSIFAFFIRDVIWIGIISQLIYYRLPTNLLTELILRITI